MLPGTVLTQGIQVRLSLQYSVDVACKKRYLSKVQGPASKAKDRLAHDRLVPQDGMECARCLQNALTCLLTLLTVHKRTTLCDACTHSVYASHSMTQLGSHGMKLAPEVVQ